MAQNQGDFMRINIYSGPSCGKSTTAAFLFSELKVKGYQIELIDEFIKGWAWEKKVPTSWDQWYIFSKQLHKEDKIARNGIHTITDSPLWMQVAYMQRNGDVFSSEVISACKKFDLLYPKNLNILLKRTVKYDNEGRYENYEQALEMDNNIKKLLDTHIDKYEEFDPTKKEILLDYVVSKLH
jgi:hypothetical protein